MDRLAEDSSHPRVFDLATIESTWPDGCGQTVARGGRAGYALVPAYTDNGENLNALGRRVAAERFLAFLTDLG